MAIQLSSYPNAHDSANPYSNVYIWLSALSLDLAAGTGMIGLTVNPNEAAWTDVPIGSYALALGQTPPGGGQFPTLATLMADADFAAAFNTIGEKLYAAVMALSAFAGATKV